MNNSTDFEDYIIRMDELDRPSSPEEEAERKGKKVSKMRSFLGGLLEKPLVLDFSKDSRSSFTTFPSYRRKRK